MAGVNGPTRLTGFSGQLDTDSLIKKLMQAERIPLDNISRKKQFTLWQREDYRSMNTALLSFRGTLDELRFENKFETAKATSSNTGVMEVNSVGSIQGTSNVKVTQLANSATIMGGRVTALSTDKVTADGKVTITGSKGSADVTITAGSSTIDSIVKDINGKSSATGVKASFDRSSGVLYLSSSTVGATSKVEVTSAGPGNALQDVFNLGTLSKTGDDAKFTVNGNPTEITSSSNSVVINGVQVNLKGIGEATIIASTDHSGVADKIKNFVSKYNDLIDLFSTTTSTKKNRDYQPLTSEEKEAMTEKEVDLWEKKARAGTLYNDSLLSGTLTALRSNLNTPLDVPNDQLQMLSQIGITVKKDYKEKGKLEIDEVKLQDAINNRFDEVKQLFLKSSDTKADTPENAKKRKQELGFADRLFEEINVQLDKFKKKIGSGSIEAWDDSALGLQLKDLGTKETAMKRRLSDVENRYFKQFTAMEVALQKMSSQSSWLGSQLG
ncbi:flagellar filament capping protein FliD [Paenibacillus chitinolyticus]|uniref:flagellar filament capping protein FliD n=1 Tax=Paenibacillus chitinolyticus TaxID=79263 RepID=UPI00366EA183